MKQLVTLLLLAFTITTRAQNDPNFIVIKEGIEEIKKGSGAEETLWHKSTDVHNLTITEKCVSGKLKGYVIHYYLLSGNKKNEGMMNGDKYTGLWKFYSEARKEQVVKTENYNENGELDGESVSYDPITQIVTAKGQFKKGRRVGEWMFFNGNTGIIKSIEKMTSDGGKYDYEEIAFDDEGNARSKGLYINNAMSGEWLFYNRAGGLSSKLYYKLGKVNGAVELYDSLTGFVTRECTYKDDKEVGLSKRYYPGSHKLMLTVEYENNKANGMYSKYDSTTGTLIRRGMCKDNEWVGEWISYYPGTEKIRARTNYTAYSNKYTVSYYDLETGKKLSYGAYNNDKRLGKWTFYYKDGISVREEINYDNGVAHGQAKAYDSLTSAVIAKGDFKEGKREGKWKYYTAAQDLAREEYYKNGKLNGKQTRYSEKGNPVWTNNYLDGETTGETIQLYKDTKNVWYTINYSKGHFNGELHSYFPSGKLKRFELWENGKRISGTCYGESGDKVPYYQFYSEEQCTRPFDYYTMTSMAYPAEAVEQKIQGIVRVSFDIDTDGKVSNIQLIEGIGAGCDEEAIRLITYMPPWSPRTVDGVPVPCSHVQEIEFKLN